MNALSSLTSRIRKFQKHSRLPVRILSGTEKISGEPLDMLYAGTPSQIAYTKSLFFPDHVAQADLGTHFCWSLNHIGKRNGCHIVAAVQSITAKNLLPRGGYVLPLWIEAFANTTASPHDTKDHSMKKDIKRMTKNDLVCEVCTSREDFEFFWERMYIPYAHAQYGDTVIVETEDNYFEQVNKGTLVLFFACRHGRRLAGGVVSIKDKIPRYRYLGVLDGDPAHRNIGAPAATYIFMLDWAHRTGHQQVNMGGCRPFLKDGVLQYKKKFNITLDPTICARVLYIKPLSDAEGLISSLVSNPIIRIDGDRLCVTIFEHKTHEVDVADSEWQYCKQIISGLDRIERVRLG